MTFVFVQCVLQTGRQMLQLSSQIQSDQKSIFQQLTNKKHTSLTLCYCSVTNYVVACVLHYSTLKLTVSRII